MQVMPFHAGKWGCGSADLFDIESNICHGVAVLADNLRGAKTLPKALLGYNGCVRGTNTPAHSSQRRRSAPVVVETDVRSALRGPTSTLTT